MGVETTTVLIQLRPLRAGPFDPVQILAIEHGIRQLLELTRPYGVRVHAQRALVRDRYKGRKRSAHTTADASDDHQANTATRNGLYPKTP